LSLAKRKKGGGRQAGERETRQTAALAVSKKRGELLNIAGLKKKMPMRKNRAGKGTPQVRGEGWGQ